MSKITDKMVNIPSLGKTLDQAVQDGDLSGGSIQNALKVLALKNWKLNATANDTTNSWSDVAWNGTTRIVAVNSGSGSGNIRTMYSSSGYGWVAGPTHATERSSCITCGGSAFVRGGYDSAALTPIIHSSPDGITWTSRTSPTTTSGAANLVAHNGTYYCIVYLNITGSVGSRLQQLARSTDGTTWTAKVFGAYDDDVSFTDIAAGNGIFCVTGGIYAMYMSNDGDAWSTFLNGAGAFVAATYNKVAYGDTKFVCFNTLGTGSLSKRITWKAATLSAGAFTEVSSSNLPATVTNWTFFKHLYAKGMWIFLANEGIMYSTDLVTFNTLPGVIPAGAWLDAVFADNKIVVVGGSNSINTVRSMCSLDFAELT